MKVPVLIVDDNDINLELSRAVLEAAQMEVLTAGSGEEALKVIRSKEVKLALLDLKLEDMSGYDLAGILQRDPVTRSILLVAYSAFAMKTEESKALNHGFHCFISKPIAVREFPAQVKKLLVKTGFQFPE